MHEQTPVPGKQCAILGFHRLQQLSILRVWVVSDIKAKQAQVAGEFAKMSIRDKALNTDRL